MSDFRGLYNVRDATSGDMSFILATFLRGLYYGDSWFSLIPKDIFMDHYKVYAKTFITSPNTTVKVACLPEDPDVILGYSIMSNDFTRLDWVYVKKDWRNKGIGRSLVPQYLTTVTHLSELGKKLLPKFEHCVFNPFAIK